MRKIFLRPFWVLPITPHKSLLHWFLPTPVCWQGWKGFQSFLRLIYSHLVLKTIRGWGWDPGEACTTVYAYSSGKKENSPPNLCRKSWAWQFSGVVCEVVQGHGMLYILCTWCVYFLYRLPFPNVTIARLHWGNWNEWIEKSACPPSPQSNHCRALKNVLGPTHHHPFMWSKTKSVWRKLEYV